MQEHILKTCSITKLYLMLRRDQISFLFSKASQLSKETGTSRNKCNQGLQPLGQEYMPT